MKTADLLTLTALAGATAITVYLYPTLPELVAVHFDMHGNADRYWPKAQAALALPAFAALLAAALRLGLYRVAAASREDAAQELERARLPAKVALTTWFMALLHAGLLLHATRSGPAIGSLVGVLAGGLFIGLGLMIPRVQRNAWVGIRTAWTLRSPEIWARTQRFGGALFVIGGAACVLAGLLWPAAAVLAVPATAVGAALGSMLYSARLAARRVE